MDAMYEPGDTVYFADDPEPGVVEERRAHQLGGYTYLVSFVDQPETWPGYWYREQFLFDTPMV